MYNRERESPSGDAAGSPPPFEFTERVFTLPRLLSPWGAAQRVRQRESVAYRRERKRRTNTVRDNNSRVVVDVEEDSTARARAVT